MGYRTYIGKIPKTEWEKITDLSLDDLYKLKGVDREDDYLSMSELCEDIYEFGKYTEFDDEKFYTPFFRNKETQEYYSSDHDFHIVGKDFFEHVIEHYVELVRKYFRRILDPFIDGENGGCNFNGPMDTAQHKLAFVDCADYVRGMAQEWGIASFFDDTRPFKLGGDVITNSWKYEYSIFELVRIYKTFDWENDYLVYYGW
jgi:hypothetical protein